MPKKKTSIGSLKKPSLEVEKQQTKQVPKPGQLGKEIDDIFSGKKNKSSSAGSLMKSSQEVERPAVQQTKQVLKPGKLGKEIDDIFGGRKKKKPELDKPEEKETKEVIAKRKRKRKRNEVDGFKNNSKTRPRKRTEDGLLVYTEDELGVNKAYAGGTPLCPFDCNCCF